MKSVLTSGLLLALVGGPLLMGCSKQDDVTPALTTPATGSVTGIARPAGGIARVVARSSAGLVVQTSPSSSTGEYNFAALAPGQYTLSFTPANRYKPVTDRSITVVAGQATTAGVVQTTSDPSITSGTLSWTVGDRTYTTTVVSGTVDRQLGTLTIIGNATSGSQTDAVSLGLRGSGPDYTFAGAGIYKLGSASYARTVNGAYVTYNDRTASNPLVVTQYDEAAGTIAGTFSYWGWDGDLGGNTVAVTNGTFSLRF